jgi:RNA polymerase sigma-70 factor (ECF subfamily)
LEVTRPAVSITRLIAEARGGSRPALDRLLRACSPYLLAIANRELSAVLRPRLDPLDAVQDTLMKAWRHFSGFGGETEGELLAWLRQILRRNMADGHRQHVRADVRSVGREIPLTRAAWKQLSDDAGGESGSTGWQSQERERHDMLENVLRRLPEHYRRALCLHTQEGLTFAQVGDRLGCSAEAARKLWGRGAKELVRLLEDVWIS